MKQWYLFYRGDALRREKLHQLGAELQSIENKNPIKLHQLGAEIASPTRVSAILDKGDMLPLFGIVPWKHHVLIASKCESVEEAFYYLQRTIDEGLSRSELEDLLADSAWSKQGKAVTNFNERLDEVQGALANNVLGYTLNPSPGYNLITEQKNETNSKKADGAIVIPSTQVSHLGVSCPTMCMYLSTFCQDIAFLLSCTVGARLRPMKPTRCWGAPGSSGCTSMGILVDSVKAYE